MERKFLPLLIIADASVLTLWNQLITPQVGKIAKGTPVVVSKALEILIEGLVSSWDVALWHVVPEFL